MKLPVQPFLVYITPSHADPRAVLETIDGACRGGAAVVQLRRPNDEGGPLLELAISARKITRGYGAILSINDRLDVALAASADGIQLRAAGIGTKDARALVGPECLLGRSVHSASEILDEENRAVQLFQFGTVFPTPSKPGLATQGLAPLRAAAHAASDSGARLVAVGGIDADNAAAVIAAGASAVAVIRAISDASDPCLAARTLCHAIATAGSAGAT
ncbi:MAG: thiamine-phosphate pyrophosphorylase [Hyphomicrobiaceae bacterium]|jgi:thiamine-phosphate pyrophosphorylase